MKTYLLASLVLVLTGLALTAAKEQAKDSATAESAAKSKRQEILSEIKKLDAHEWAGEYYAGDGLGVNTSLVIAPESGYVFEWHGCLGLYDRNYGAVTGTDERLRLSFTLENQRSGFQGIAPELIPISWGSRRYLVPADDVVGFCNDVNSGREPRNVPYGFYFLRLGDEKSAVTGLPSLPEEFRSFLLAAPVEATIIAVSPYRTRPSVAEWKFKDTPVTLDAGTEQGLRVGMELFVTRPKGTVESVRLTEVEEMRSEAIMIQIEDDEPEAEVGWRLSTRPPWRVHVIK